MVINMKQIIADMESIEECVKEQMKNLIEITRHEVVELPFEPVGRELIDSPESLPTQISKLSLKIGRTLINISTQKWADGRITNPSIDIHRPTDESRIATSEITIFPDEND